MQIDFATRIPVNPSNETEPVSLSLWALAALPTDGRLAILSFNQLKYPRLEAQVVLQVCA
jgi:hypothetical protein